MARRPADPATTQPGPQGPTTMKELKDTLWKAADKLRGSMDASQYKDVILGLVFLKYVSDAFDERRDADPRPSWRPRGTTTSRSTRLIEDTDEYTGAGVFWVPADARWGYLADRREGQPDRGTQTSASCIDEAMDAAHGGEPEPCAARCRAIFNRDSVDQRRLGELLDLFNYGAVHRRGRDQRARDLLGEVYEYFLGKFAARRGQAGGEFYTPAGVVRVIVEMLEPPHGRIYDPCCGSGGMFVQAEKFLEAHDADRSEFSSTARRTTSAPGGWRR